MRDRWPTPVGCRGGFPALGVLLGSLFRVERPLRLGFVLGSASFRASCLGFRFRAWCLVPASCLVPFLLLGAWPGFGFRAWCRAWFPFRSVFWISLVFRCSAPGWAWRFGGFGLAVPLGRWLSVDRAVVPGSGFWFRAGFPQPCRPFRLWFSAGFSTACG